MNNDETDRDIAGAKRSDDQLLQMLDESGHLWIVRGGRMGVLGPPTATLRAALRQASESSKHAQSPGPIVRMPDDNVIVHADQIYRLLIHLGIRDA